jgi:4-hydroxy-tetrahydrodipicolinate synthase
MLDNAVYVTTVTPFDSNLELDLIGTKNLVEHVVERGVKHIVPLGTTGEFSSLTMAEKKKVVDQTVKHAGNAEVIVGVSSTVLSEIVEFSKYAGDAGASSVLIVPPYYLRPSQDTMVDYFKELLDRIDMKAWVYNNPAQTKVDLTPTTIEKMSEIEGLVGIKDARSDLLAHRSVIKLLKGKKKILGGLEEYAFHSLLLGSDGFTTSIANFLPELPLGIYSAFVKGDLAEANRLSNLLMDYRSIMVGSEQPLMMHFAKKGLRRLGIIKSDSVRPPLAALDSKRSKLLEDYIEGLLRGRADYAIPAR